MPNQNGAIIIDGHRHRPKRIQDRKEKTHTTYYDENKFELLKENYLDDDECVPKRNNVNSNRSGQRRDNRPNGTDSVLTSLDANSNYLKLENGVALKTDLRQSKNETHDFIEQYVNRFDNVYQQNVRKMSRNGHNGYANEQTQLRVMIVTESFHPYTSGIARRFKEIMQRLAKRGYLIHVVTGCKGCETWTNDEKLKKKVEFSALIALEFKDKIDCALPFLLPQYGMLRAIINFKPDVIHFVEHSPATTFMAAMAKAFNIPLVWSTHTNLDFYIPLYIYPFISKLSVRIYQLLRRTFLNMADYNLTVSSDFAQLLKENGIKETVHVWKTGVDSESFNPSFRSEKMRFRMFNGHYSPEKILLVSVGRLCPEKNFEFLLNILERFPQTFLCIVGGGPYKDSLEPLFPPNQSYFMGFLQGEELASAYASADYFVYASVSETFGQVYLEAMSSGIPVVAAEGKQMKEFFIKGIHGYTWKPGDVESACDALNSAIRNRNIIAHNCRSNALNHSWDSAANQISEVYTGLSLKKRKRENFAYQNFLTDNVLFRFLKLSIRGAYYLTVWFSIMILVLSFVAPFMKVVKPKNSSTPDSANLNINPNLNNGLHPIKATKKNKRKKYKTSYRNETFSSSSSSSKTTSASNSRELSRESLVRISDGTNITNIQLESINCTYKSRNKLTQSYKNSNDNSMTNKEENKFNIFYFISYMFRLDFSTINTDNKEHFPKYHRTLGSKIENSTRSCSSFLATFSALFISILVTAIYACLH